MRSVEFFIIEITTSLHYIPQDEQSHFGLKIYLSNVNFISLKCGSLFSSFSLKSNHVSTTLFSCVLKSTVIGGSFSFKIHCVVEYLRCVKFFVNYNCNALNW